MNTLSAVIASIVLFLYLATVSFAWNDETHLAVSRATGYNKWYNSVGPDIAKLRAGKTERYNHYYHNPDDKAVTAKMVMEQVSRFNDPEDAHGHLYGAIIGSLRDYKASLRKGKYPEYHLAYCAHYIADLSQPLHNTAGDDFNRARHSANDGVVENEVMANQDRIEANMYPIVLRPEAFEEDFSREIARIAELSRQLSRKLREENRDMTKEEAYSQLGHSASIFRAVLDCLDASRRAGTAGTPFTTTAETGQKL